jgi:hypothetical protein
MSDGVVDLLELVEIYHEQCQRLVTSHRGANRVIDPVGEQKPVGEVGERVVQRLVFERLGVRLPLRDIPYATNLDLSRTQLQMAHGQFDRER